MKRIVIAVLIVILVFLGIRELHAQEAKVPIEVEEVYVNDPVGSRFLYHIKEKIRTSSQFRLSYGGEERIKLLVSTMPKYEDEPSITTVYSIVWVIPDKCDNMDVILDMTLGYCGSKAVENAAESIVAHTDQLLSTLVKLWQKMYKK